MNSELLVRLIQEWSAFNGMQSGKNLGEFAAWLLEKETHSQEVSEENEEIKFKLIELSRIVELATKKIFEGEQTDLQAFRILSIVEKLRNPRKQDVVINSLLETSTGFYVIKFLVGKKLLNELADPKDKRSIQVSLSQAGKTYLQNKRKELQKVLILKGLQSASDKKTFVKILNTIHLIHKNKLQLNLK
jgi:hypothetical protein